MVRFFSIAKKRVTISTGYTIILLSAGLRLELFFVIHRSFKISRAEAESAKTSTSADVSAGTGLKRFISQLTVKVTKMAAAARQLSNSLSS